MLRRPPPGSESADRPVHGGWPPPAAPRFVPGRAAAPSPVRRTGRPECAARPGFRVRRPRVGSRRLAASRRSRGPARARRSAVAGWGSGIRSTLAADHIPDTKAVAAAALTGLSQRRKLAGLVVLSCSPVTNNSPAKVVPPWARCTADSLAARATGSADRIRTAAARSVPVIRSQSMVLPRGDRREPHRRQRWPTRPTYRWMRSPGAPR